jgi:formylglycine-generating enzyme required for sulfatase activity
MSSDERLEDLLLVWEELTEQGQQPSVEELCQHCPELADKLKESIAALKRMAWLEREPANSIYSGAGSAAASGFGSEPSLPAAAGQPGTEAKQDASSSLLVLGDYSGLHPIGAGGMGTVYKAVHRHMERVVALKVVREDAVASPDAIARFQREVKAAARLEHPNIVTAYDAGEQRGICYLVMEFVDGCDLARHVREQGPLAVEQAVDCAIQAARGLGYAHQQGMIHRDIKPANLMLGRSGTVKVLDLGLARFREVATLDTASLPSAAGAGEHHAVAPLHDAGSGHGVTGLREDPLTQAGTVHGTLAYMAPEQREDPRGADHRADIYSLGCTIYFLLTASPLPGLGADPTGRSAGHESVAASLRRVRPEVPSGVAAVVEKMTEPRPDDRFASMSQVVEALQDATDSGPRAARRRLRRRAVGVLLALFSAGGLIVAGWAAYGTYGEWHAAALRQRLLDAPTADVPAIIAELTPYRRWVDPQLRAAYDDARARHDARRQLHASLGLLPVDSRQLDYLYQRLLIAEAPEFPVIRDALSQHRSELNERLWAVWGSAAQTVSQRFRAAGALATYAPHDSRWSATTCGEVAGILAAEPTGVLDDWSRCFRPIRDLLQTHVRINYRLSGREQEARRVAAARILASWFAEDPRVLIDLLLDADPAQFAVLSPALPFPGHEALHLVAVEVHRPAPAEREARAAWARRQAAARALLLRFGQTGQVWPTLQHTPDPTVRSYLIHRLGPSGADPRLLADRLRVEKDVSVRRALILALGGFPEQGLPSSQRDALIGELAALWRGDPDPGIHGAAEWLLRQWGQHGILRRIDLAMEPADQHQWFRNGQGQTMIVFPSPVQYMMGSATAEPGTPSDEAIRPVTIARSFAISNKEVTVEEFGRFLAENPDQPRPETGQEITGPDHPCPRRTVGVSPPVSPCPRRTVGVSLPVSPRPRRTVGVSPPVSPRPRRTVGVSLPDHPQTHVTWQAAVAYCRWLSRKEGIPEDEQCYPSVSPTAEQVGLPADFLDREGYRLATEAEWEYACRAGSCTSRFYGNAVDLLDAYAWSSRGSVSAGTRSVGMLKPNDFGLFDLYGNVMEWCHHAADDDWPDATGTARGGAMLSYPAERFRLRGASHRNRLEEARSARRYQYKPGRMKTYLGFRLARTLPPKSLVVVPRGQPLWGQAEFLVQGPGIPFAINQVQGGVQVLPAGGTTPACVRVTAQDGQARRFSCVIERTDTHQAVTVRGLVFSADWNLQFYAWDQANRDELNRPADWAKLLAGPPLATRTARHMDFDWGLLAPAPTVPRDQFALVATTEVSLPAGKYQLWATGDNGVRVFIDGIQRIDFNVWLPDKSPPNLVEVQLEGREHSLRVEHYESRDAARVRVGLRPLE